MCGGGEDGRRKGGQLRRDAQLHPTAVRSIQGGGEKPFASRTVFPRSRRARAGRKVNRDIVTVNQPGPLPAPPELLRPGERQGSLGGECQHPRDVAAVAVRGLVTTTLPSGIRE